MNEPAKRFYETPAWRRGFTAVAGLVFVVMGVLGVSGMRGVAREQIGIEVPAWWYLIAVGPPLVFLLIALKLPTAHRYWRRDFDNLVLLACMASFLAAPMIYVIYDFENPRLPGSNYQDKR